MNWWLLCCKIYPRRLRNVECSLRMRYVSVSWPLSVLPVAWRWCPRTEVVCPFTSFPFCNHCSSYGRITPYPRTSWRTNPLTITNWIPMIYLTGPGTISVYTLPLVPMSYRVVFLQVSCGPRWLLAGPEVPKSIARCISRSCQRLDKGDTSDAGDTAGRQHTNGSCCGQWTVVFVNYVPYTSRPTIVCKIRCNFTKEPLLKTTLIVLDAIIQIFNIEMMARL